MDKFVTSLAIVIALASAFVWGWCAGGRHSEKVVISKMETTTCDTVWTEVHDTCWQVERAEIIRTDTVRLAQVVCAEIAPTTHDTLTIHDSVYVEVPIERKVFTGEGWRVAAHGYRVGLDEVWFSRPTVYVTKTQTKTKRWAFNVGAQIGYGYTVHGASPYIGLGAGFGYTF